MFDKQTRINEMFYSTTNQKVTEDIECSIFGAITVSNVSEKTRWDTRRGIRTLDIQLDGHPGTHHLRLKIDTGAQANTLRIRVYRQMYPHNISTDGTPKSGTLEPTQNVLIA